MYTGRNMGGCIQVEKEFELIQMRDQEKRSQCKEQGITLIEIKDSLWDDSDEMLINYLSNTPLINYIKNNHIIVTFKKFVYKQ